MAKKLTVHLCDTARDSYVEVDGERVEGVFAVRAAYPEGQRCGTVELMLHDATFVDERSGAGRSA